MVEGAKIEVAKGQSVGAGSVVIHSPDITLSLPARVARGAPIPMSVVDSLSGEPIDGMELIFMPEHGPFRRYRTEAAGVVLLEAPPVSGTLRLETLRDHYRLIEIRV